jgi:transposase, IS5 family
MMSLPASPAVDEESGLVRQAEMTPANVHDSRLGEALIQGDEQGFFAMKRALVLVRAA